MPRPRSWLFVRGPRLFIMRPLLPVWLLARIRWTAILGRRRWLASRHARWAVLRWVHAVRASGITTRGCSFSPITLAFALSLPLAHFKFTIPFKSLSLKPFPLVPLPLCQHPLVFVFENHGPFWVVLDTWSKLFTSRIHIGMGRSSHVYWARRRRMGFRLTAWPRRWYWAAGTSLKFSRMFHGAHGGWWVAERLWCPVPLHFRCHVHTMRRPSSSPCFPSFIHSLILFRSMGSSI